MPYQTPAECARPLQMEARFFAAAPAMVTLKSTLLAKTVCVIGLAGKLDVPTADRTEQFKVPTELFTK